MADFWKGLGGILKHPINEAKWMWEQTEDIGKPLLKGDFGEAFDQLKGSFGEHQDMMSDTITVPLIGDNKLSRNSDAIAGAIVGGVLAAPALAGGAGASGAGGGGAAAGGSSFGNFAGLGSGTGGGGALSGSGLGWQGGAQMGSLGSTFTPTTAFGGAGAGGGGTGAMGLSTAYAPTTAFGKGSGGMLGSGTGTGGGFDWSKFSQMAQNLQTKEEPAPQVNSVGAQTGGRWGGFNSKIYQNPLLEKEYMRLYTEPTYKKPI